eukprot:6200627-Pleurochrysis_carterae.AAC.1
MIITATLTHACPLQAHAHADVAGGGGGGGQASAASCGRMRASAHVNPRAMRTHLRSNLFVFVLA